VLATGIRAESLSRTIPECGAYRLSVSEARRRGSNIKFVRRMGDDFPRAIDLVSSGRVNVTALVMHLETLNAAPELFEALAQSRLGYLKALPIRTDSVARGGDGTVFFLGPNLTGHNPPWGN
jgi:L-iditol 2-dehydrogenase